MAQKVAIQLIRMPTGEYRFRVKEHDTAFVDDVCARVADLGVGVFRTTDHVLRDVKQALEEVLARLNPLD